MNDSFDPVWYITKRDSRMPIGIRFGRNGYRRFSERYQGQHNIPKRYYYLPGGWITIVLPMKGRR